MAGVVRSLGLCAGTVLGPGVLAWMIVRVAQALQWSVFPMMSPERVPEAVAIYVTQWWLTLIGLGLLGAATYSWLYERSHPRPEGY